MWVVPAPCVVCAVATPGWEAGGRCWWRLFASPAGVVSDANSGGAVGVILCRGRGGDGRGVVGDVPWLVVVWIVVWVLALLVLSTVRVS